MKPKIKALATTSPASTSRRCGDSLQQASKLQWNIGTASVSRFPMIIDRATTDQGD
jgi:hypothetical protein